MSSMSIGRAATFVLKQLQRHRVLYGKEAVVSSSLSHHLPGIDSMLAEAGCTALEREAMPLEECGAVIRLRESQVMIRLGPPGPGDTSAKSVAVFQELPIGTLPVVAWVLRRSLCDFSVWVRLLCTSSGLALAGRPLVVDSYCEIGRVIASRARGFGMVVSVRDPEPRRCLEALHDGFDLAGPPGKYGEEREPEVVSVARLLEYAETDSGWDDTLAAVQDEMSAACLVATAVAIHQKADGDIGPDSWRLLCDRLLCDALIQARESVMTVGPSAWDAMKWNDLK